MAEGGCGRGLFLAAESVRTLQLTCARVYGRSVRTSLLRRELPFLNGKGDVVVEERLFRGPLEVYTLENTNTRGLLV